MRPSNAEEPARRYRLIEILGRSGIGEVYLAENTADQRVVLRVLNDEVARLGEVWQRMQDEARVLGRLGHPYIAVARDHVQLENRRAIVMDWVPGADLEHLVAALELAGEPFPPRAAFEVGAAIAHALDAASTTVADGRALGLLHRDLKPSNVRITIDGGVKVLDFGIARGPDEPDAISAGLVGTESYMAPERLLGSGDGTAGDVYGAAATLVEVVLGRPLGRTPILADVHSAWVDDVLRRFAARLEAPGQTVVRALDLVRRALDVRPEARPAASELATSLEELARELDGESLPLFAARFLPEIDQVLGRMRTPVAGLLGERVATPGTMSHGQDTVVAVRPRRWRPQEIVGALVGAAVISATCGASAMFGLAGLHAALDPPPAPVIAVSAPAAKAAIPATIGFPSVPSEVRSVTPPEPARNPQPAPRKPRAGRRVDRAMFVVREASVVRVTCGEVSAEGTSTVRITEFPAGTCTIVATAGDGRTVSGEAELQGPERVLCEVDGRALRCSPSP